MKTTILLMLLFCATVAFSQSGAVAAVLQSQPVVLELPSHAEHASAVPLAPLHYLNEPTGSTYGQGVKPLWEFPVREETVSLGEAARQLRQEHLLAKKAVKVFSN